MGKETAWLRLNNYTAVRISNYQSMWQLQKGNINKTDEIFPAYIVPTWKEGDKIHLRKKKDGELLNIPDVTNLGNVKEDALAVIQKLYTGLKNL